MRILLETKVRQHYDKVYKGFDVNLFKALAPVFPKMILRKFEGCKKNDLVEVDIDFSIGKQPFYSQVIEAGKEHRGYYFIDQGTRLPFFLKYWEHKHRIKRCGEGSMIVDDIYYNSPTKVAGFLIFPFMWLSFYARKSIYRRYFFEID